VEEADAANPNKKPEFCWVNKKIEKQVLLRLSPHINFLALRKFFCLTFINNLFHEFPGGSRITCYIMFQEQFSVS
jgi:hypothetical protein